MNDFKILVYQARNISNREKSTLKKEGFIRRGCISDLPDAPSRRINIEMK